uniref:Uncharacterized protein n=1 Tax=Anguilla anguilla TaxID=7936 RepID=A0A0E9W2X3_ANGAN
MTAHIHIARFLISHFLLVVMPDYKGI